MGERFFDVWLYASNLWQPSYCPPVRYSKKPDSIAIAIDATNHRSKTVSEKFVEWSEVTNIHGSYYVFEKGVKRASNIFWAIIWLSLLGIALHFVRLAYLAWCESPVLTTVSTTDLPIEEVEFPVITICGLGTIKETVQQAFHGQVTRYLRSKGKSVNMSATADELLQEHGYDFLHEHYPGATMSPVEMVATMTSQDPTEHIRAQIVINGGYDDCTADRLYDLKINQSKEAPDTRHICDNLLYDTDYERCYEYASMSMQHDDALGECWSKLGSLLYPFDDKQLFGIIRLIKDGRLDVLRDGHPIWVDLTRSSDGSYKLLDGKRLQNVTFQYLNLSNTNIDDPTQRCFVMHYSEDLEMFIGKQASCRHSYPSLCYSFVQEEPDCSRAKGTKSVTTNNNLSDIKQLDRMLNPKTRSAMNKDVARKKKRYSKAFHSLDTVAAYPSLFELLWYSQLPCFDVAGFFEIPYQRSLLKQCRWKGIDMPCSAIFKTVPTDRGMCCTFNMKEADDIFQKSAYQTMVSQLQRTDKNNSHTYSGLPDWYWQASEPTSQQGINRGLSITLDAHTDLIGSTTVSEDFQGFLAMVSDRDSYPLANQKSIRISPGHDTLVAMSAVDVRADLEAMAVTDRKCYYPKGSIEDDMMLMHNNYSQASCVLECRIAFAVDRMAQVGEEPCIPWYLPTLSKNVRVCNPWSAVAFREQIDLIPNDQCLYCLPDCQATSYRHHVSASPFRRCDDRNLLISNFCTLEDNGLPDPYIFGMRVRDQFEERLPKPLPEYVGRIKNNERSYDGVRSRFKPAGGEMYDAYAKDIAVVTFFFESPTVFQYTRQPRMTWIDFLSQVGGLLGLCMGFSFCMFVELVYWGAYRLWFNVEK